VDPILSIDTSDQILGIDLSRDGEPVATLVIDEPRVHAAQLVPTVVEVLSGAGCTMSDLAGVAVAMGPGSYTGLRIGVSAAKGLCYALGIPLMGIPTMDAMARALSRDGDAFPLITCLASRKGEVYAQGWMVGSTVSSLSEAVSLPTNAADDFVRAFGLTSAALVGSGSRSLLDAVTGGNELGLYRFPQEHTVAAVRGVALLAAERFAQGVFDDVAAFEPFYLKDFVAKVGRSPFSAASRR